MGWPHLYTITFSTLIFLQSSPIAAQNSGNISVGLSLSATINGSSWLSPSDDFAFGFHKLPSSSNLFLLAIWYAKLPDTIVWYANDGNTVREGSSVMITADEGLVLSDPQGTNLWDTSSTLSGGGISYGFMNDSGNFVLKQSNIDNPVWQSFHHPTDTLLPGQSLGSDEAINSRLSESNFTTGRFQYRLNDGSMLQNARDPTTGYAYSAYHVSDPGYQGQAQRYVYNESGYMYILREDGYMYDMLPSGYIPLEDHYQRLILRFDGILTWYSVPKTSITDGWSIFQEVPGNICMGRTASNLGLGICGLNSICLYGDDRNPRCMCPQGYSLLDPNDPYSSCNPNFKPHSCDQGFAESSTNNEYKLVRLQNTDFTYNDYERIDSRSEEDCQNACLQDCFCAAASFQLEAGNSGCWKKKAPLYNGRKDSRVTQAFWIKFPRYERKNNVVPFIFDPKLWMLATIPLSLNVRRHDNSREISLYHFFDVRKQKAHELTVSIVNTSKPKVSTYPEKLLPFNKRKSRYYVCQEDKNVMSTNEENSSSRSETKETVKIRSLSSIYRRTSPILSI